VAARQHWYRFLCAAALVIVTIGPAARSAGSFAAPTSGTSTESPALAAHAPRTGRFLYAVNQAAATRGSISEDIKRFAYFAANWKTDFVGAAIGNWRVFDEPNLHAPRTTASPSITNCLMRFFRADSAIQALRPVLPAPRDQPQPIAITLHAQSEAVLLDLVKLLGAGRNLGGGG
jgi:hypothetical protein